MVRVVAAMKIFNEIWHIKKTVNDIINLVDHIIVIDGAWQHYPGGTPQSQDGTREFLQDLSNVSVEIHDNGDSLWDNQPMARGQYFRYGRPGDWIFTIDGDYEVHCDTDLKSWIEDNIGNETNTVLVPFIDDETLAMCYFPLIIKWESDLNYRGNHYSLCVGDKKRLISAVRISQMTIHHCHKNKPKEKKDNMRGYSEWRREQNWKED